MSTPAPGNVTEMLLAFSTGDQEALQRLMPLVYRELRALARRALRGERRDHTLGTTGLVHEAYLRLIDQNRVDWRHRAQFFGVAAKMMRRILVDHARKQGAAKRGGSQERVPLDDSSMPIQEQTVDLAALDDALRRLAELDPRAARVVELRFFGGLTIEESAGCLEVSPATVKREWTVAKSWLRREITERLEENRPRN